MLALAIRRRLDVVWNRCQKVRVIGNRLYVKGESICAKSAKLRIEANKMFIAGSDSKILISPEGNKMYADRHRLFAEGEKMCSDCNAMRAHGDKIKAQGSKMCAESRKIWAKAVLKFAGNILMQWHSDTECELETGDIFGK